MPPCKSATIKYRDLILFSDCLTKLALRIDCSVQTVVCSLSIKWLQHRVAPRWEEAWPNFVCCGCQRRILCIFCNNFEIKLLLFCYNKFILGTLRNCGASRFPINYYACYLRYLLDFVVSFTECVRTSFCVLFMFSFVEFLSCISVFCGYNVYALKNILRKPS